MGTAFSEVFSGDVLADNCNCKDPIYIATAPSNRYPSTPASDTLGSQPATGRQPQGQAGQAGRASGLQFSQVRPGRSTWPPALRRAPQLGLISNRTENSRRMRLMNSGRQPTHWQVSLQQNLQRQLPHVYVYDSSTCGPPRKAPVSLSVLPSELAPPPNSPSRTSSCGWYPSCLWPTWPICDAEQGPNLDLVVADLRVNSEAQLQLPALAHRHHRHPDHEAPWGRPRQTHTGGLGERDLKTGE